MFCWLREIFSDSQTLLQRTPYHYREFASDNIEKKGDYFQYSVHSRIRAWMNVSIWHKPRSLNEVAHAMLSVGLHDVFPPLPIQLLIRPEDFTLESSSSPVLLSPKPPSLRLPLQSHHIHPAPLSLGLNAHARFLYPLQVTPGCTSTYSWLWTSRTTGVSSCCDDCPCHSSGWNLLPSPGSPCIIWLNLLILQDLASPIDPNTSLCAPKALCTDHNPYGCLSPH